MKLQAVSDLHLEFHYRDIPNAGADVLILAGDIMTAAALAATPQSPLYSKREEYLKFLKDVSSRFAHVVYVMGNHEHYKYLFNDTYNTLKFYLPTNVHLLNNEYIDLDGYRFIGTTLWTDLGNPISEMRAEGCMNDYRIITYHNGANYHKLRASITTKEHKKAVEFIRKSATDNTIVVTHHGPSYLSISEKYKGDPLNDAYVTDLSELILDTEPLAWFHGHVHCSNDYRIGNTRVITNPGGYGNENPDFDPKKVFEF